MKNNIYVLNQRQDETFDAAGKAMRDVFSVLADKKAKIDPSICVGCGLCAQMCKFDAFEGREA